MKFILFSALLFMLSSCKVIDVMLNPNSYVKIPSNDSNYLLPAVSDTIRVMNADGEFAKSPIKPKSAQRYTLRNIGDYCIIKDKEFVEIVLDDIDFTKVSLDIRKNYETNEIKISIVPTTNEVFLETKCQTIVRSGSYDFLPPISVKKGLNPEQVIVTPVVDDTTNCNIIGYEIRYGSEERGCKRQAKANLINFEKCFGKPKTRTTKEFKKNFHLKFFNLE